MNWGIWLMAWHWDQAPSNEVRGPVQRKRTALVAARVLLLLFLATAEDGFQVGRASELVTHVGDYTIQNWQLEQGLPQISVTSIAQTPEGYLWVGTFNGLARFDGLRFTIFHEDNTPALGNSGILYLQVDEQGSLWIITVAGGLVRLTAGHFTSVLNDNARLLLTEIDPDNGSIRRLLLQDRNQGWQQITPSRLLALESLNRPGGIDSPWLLFENTAPTWVAHKGGIKRSQETTFPVFTSQEGRSNKTDLVINSATPSRKGGYWVATSNSVYRLAQGRLSSPMANLPFVTLDPLKMMEDGQGTLWAGQWGKGLFRLDARGSWQWFGAGTGMGDNQVNCLYRDREGNLWVGTGQGGLYRFRRRVFHMYDTENGPNVVMSVTQDRTGQMWLAVNGGGLHTWADGKLKAVTEPATLRSYGLTYSVLADVQDAVWVGLYGVKALHWQGDTIEAYGLSEVPDRENPKWLMTPHALFKDHSGALWLGCTHGLLRFERGRWTRFGTQDGLSCDQIGSLAEDRAGTLFIGTDGGGLNSLRNGKFTSFTEKDGLADNHVTSLLVDADDILWIGAIHGGVNRFKQGQLATAGLKDGLPTETIGTMVEDDLGNLWLGSNRGIIRVDRQALNDYLDRKRDAVVWDIFGLSDGLSTHGCTGASQPASCKAQDGRLWFCTIKGAAVVNPYEVPRNQLPPSVVIEEVIMDDQLQGLPMPASSHNLTVPAGTHRVEFRFTGLSLAAAEKVRFRYRMYPFDDKWVEAGTRRVAYYTGIPSGYYRFQVTACNNDGVWNENGAELAVVILPPWWKAWWFRGLLALGAASLLFGAHEWRISRLRQARLAQEYFARQLLASQENERRRIAGELHDGLGQDLLVIANQAQLGLAKTHDLTGTAVRLIEIAETAKQALQQARRMAHNLRPGLLEELGFTEAVQASMEKAGHSSGLSVKLDLANVDGLLPPEFEVNLFRIIQEALNNILKHAAATEVRVALTHEPAALRLVVEDNGRGFEASLLGRAGPGQRGMGMGQIFERAGMMGGRVDLQSRPGHGTRLVVEVPLKES